MNAKMSERTSGGSGDAAVSFHDGRMLIGGRMVESVSGRWLDSHNPANLQPIGRVPMANLEDAALAFEAARVAQKEWAALDMSQRGKLLLAFCDRMQERAEEILAIEVADTGNTIGPMRNDLTNGLARLRYFVGLAYELKGHSVPSTAKNLHFTVREPYGVCARILAFNHPINFALSGIGAPLMAGNAIILKPSEQSPLSASIFGEVAAEVLPAGIVNVLTGGMEAGQALVAHPRIKRLSFVGSARTRHGHPARCGRKRNQAHLPGAWRQEPVHRVSGRTGRQGRRRRRQGHEFRLAGSVMRVNQPIACAREDL